MSDRNFFKLTRKENATTISNDLLQDNSLSFAARGMAAYLLTMPESYKIRLSDLMKAGGIGRDKARNIMNELTVAGYLFSYQPREKGMFAENEVYVSDDKEWILEIQQSVNS